MPETLRLSHFDSNLRETSNDDEPEDECDCPFPWWWLLIAAAAGGGAGYYAGQRKRKNDELDEFEPFDEP